MNYGGLDFSLTAPGAATIKNGKLHAEVIDTSQFIKEIPCSKNTRYKKNGVSPLGTLYAKGDVRLIQVVDAKRRNRYLISVLLDMFMDCDILFIEDYAFGATGMLTEIAEVLGAIKYQLPASCKIYLVSPNTLKKAVTGKGDATKDKVIAAINKMGIPVKNDNVADATGLVLMSADVLKGKVREWNPLS